MATEKEVDPSFCHWFNLDEHDISLLADMIVKAYNKENAKSDYPMFPGELRALIVRVATTDGNGVKDV